MRRPLLLFVLAVVVVACGGGGTTTPDDDLSDLSNPRFVGGRFKYARNGLAGRDKLTFDGNAVFERDRFVGRPVTYRLVYGTMVVDHDFDADFCRTNGRKSVDLVPGNGAFTVEPGGGYAGGMTLHVTFPSTMTCTLPGGGTTRMEVQDEGRMDLEMVGTLAYFNVMNGEMPPQDVAGFRFTGSWDMTILTANP